MLILDPVIWVWLCTLYLKVPMNICVSSSGADSNKWCINFSQTSIYFSRFFSIILIIQTSSTFLLNSFFSSLSNLAFLKLFFFCSIKFLQAWVYTCMAEWWPQLIIYDYIWKHELIYWIHLIYIQQFHIIIILVFVRFHLMGIFTWNKVAAISWILRDSFQ